HVVLTAEHGDGAVALRLVHLLGDRIEAGREDEDEDREGRDQTLRRRELRHGASPCSGGRVPTSTAGGLPEVHGLRVGWDDRATPDDRPGAGDRQERARAATLRRREARVAATEAVEAAGPQELSTVEDVAREQDEGGEPVRDRRPEARRRRLGKIARRDRDLGEPEARGHALRGGLLVEDEAVG